MTGVAYNLHGERHGNMGVECADYDNDGDRDIYVPCGHLYDNVDLFSDVMSYAANQ